MISNDELREKCWEYIKENKMSVTKFAREAKTNPCGIKRWLEKRNLIREDTMIHLCTYLNLEFDEPMMKVTERTRIWKANMCELASRGNTSVLKMETACGSDHGYINALALNGDLKLIPVAYVEKLCELIGYSYDYLSKKLTPEQLKPIGIKVRTDDRIEKNTTKMLEKRKIEQERKKKAKIITGYPINPALCKKCKYGNRGTSAISTGYCQFWEHTDRSKRRGSTYDNCVEFEPRRKKNGQENNIVENRNGDS